MSATQDLLGLGQPPSSNTKGAAGLTLNLSSNNPFRNRAASPSNFSPPPPRSPFDDSSARPTTSNNPFLDPDFNSAAPLLSSPDKMAQTGGAQSSASTAEDLFGNLNIRDDANKKFHVGPDGRRPSFNGPPRGPPRGAPRGENIPPLGRGPPPGSHRPTRSQEEALRTRRKPVEPNGSKPGESPQRRSNPRLRRNSESSIMEKPATEEEKRIREMRQRDRERRNRDGQPKPKKLDIIDQLDATSIYGTGLFHHDGPFDACNPHRNRKGSRRAPMQAFAKDSANNTIGGAGPINKRPDHKLFMGTEPYDATRMYAGEKLKKSDIEQFDPKGVTIEHGEETLGLGSSTFLEGAPAARTAILRTQNESAQEAAEREQGLGRTKSVVQRFKSIKRGPREYNGQGRVTSPEAMYTSRSTGGATGGGPTETNPFFAEFDKSPEQITVRNRNSNPKSPLTPPPVIGNGLERRATADATMDGPEDSQSKQGGGGGGFLSRVRSLKGGRRQAPPPPPAKDSAPHPGTAM
ncbi:Pal1-domain-containing protein [Xylariaceae sp. FL0255]|nr:Pal1-domain-containing protein [Xylariaceae sp. FL0255]